MEHGQKELLERIQELTARLIAENPAGHRLCLIGGYRYRLLDRSSRLSTDIDYHFPGDLGAKQGEVLSLLRRKLLPEAKGRWGLDGTVRPARGPDADSPSLRAVQVAFFRPDVAGSRIELPVEITRIPCLDPPAVRTAAGTVFLTVSDADMVESKVLALVDRPFVEERDLVDLFLFRDSLPANSDLRLKEKSALRGMSPKSVEEGLAKLRENQDIHARGLDRILEDQLEAPAAEHLRLAGGGRMMLEVVLSLLERVLRQGRGEKP